MTSRMTALVAAVLALPGLVGCDDNGGGGGGGDGGGRRDGGSEAGGGSGDSGGGGGGSSFNSSLADSKVLGDLTTSEAQTLCDEAEAYADSTAGQAMLADTMHLFCMMTSVMAAGYTPPTPTTDEEAQTACAVAYADCDTEPAPSTCEPPPANCTATVAELEACSNAMVDYIAQAADAVGTCAEVTLADLAGGTTNPFDDPPAACDTLDTKCPGWNESGSGGP